MNSLLRNPILVLTAAALLSGAAITLRPSSIASDLTLWTFTNARAHATPAAPATAADQPTVLDEYRATTGRRVAVKLMSARALDTRLLSLFMGTGADVQSPDVVEIEVGSIGKFFRPPASDIGFFR